jgi:hypothetical protein
LLVVGSQKQAKRAIKIHKIRKKLLNSEVESLSMPGGGRRAANSNI